MSNISWPAPHSLSNAVSQDIGSQVGSRVLTIAVAIIDGLVSEYPRGMQCFPKQGMQYPPSEAHGISQGRHAVSPKQGTWYPPMEACGIPQACLTKTSFICGSCHKSLSMLSQVLCAPSDSLSLPSSHCRLTLPKTVRSLASQKVQERTTSKQVLPLAPDTSFLSVAFPCPSPPPPV